jgi:hypothetical protein
MHLLVHVVQSKKCLGYEQPESVPWRTDVMRTAWLGLHKGIRLMAS